MSDLKGATAEQKEEIKKQAEAEAKAAEERKH